MAVYSHQVSASVDMWNIPKPLYRHGWTTNSVQYLPVILVVSFVDKCSWVNLTDLSSTIALDHCMSCSDTPQIRTHFLFQLNISQAN